MIAPYHFILPTRRFVQISVCSVNVTRREGHDPPLQPVLEGSRKNPTDLWTIRGRRGHDPALRTEMMGGQMEREQRYHRQAADRMNPAPTDRSVIPRERSEKWESHLVPNTQATNEMPRRGLCPLLAMTAQGSLAHPCGGQGCVFPCFLAAKRTPPEFGGVREFIPAFRSPRGRACTGGRRNPGAAPRPRRRSRRSCRPSRSFSRRRGRAWA